MTKAVGKANLDPISRYHLTDCDET